ncbi:MAG: hypothetical protein Q7R95_08085, partial [bacterium]|nr:hypothetical protein [bacterium]
MKNIFKKIRTINFLKLFNLKQVQIPVIILIGIGIFIGINVLLSFFPLRFDYSYGQAYTLSNSTKNILKKLDNNITIKFYAS